MPAERKPQKWWQTLPGVLTATAATITAVTGLVVALRQLSVFGHTAKRPPAEGHARADPAEGTKPDGAGAETGTTATSPAGREQAGPFPVSLKAGEEVRLGGNVYKILSARLDRYNTEKRALHFTVRMTNHGRFPANFWSSTFRLIVDGVPKAPEDLLDKVVASESADEGELEFIVPAATQSAILRLIGGDESTEIPFELSGARVAERSE